MIYKRFLLFPNNLYGKKDKNKSNWALSQYCMYTEMILLNSNLRKRLNIFFVKLLSVPGHVRTCMLWDDEIYNHHLPRSVSLEWYSFNISILCITYAFGKAAIVNT